jgi:hypothetical protein
MGKGTLTVETRTADEALPIEGVRVVIRDENGEVLADFTTDASGNSETLSLDAPDKEHSQTPEGAEPRYRTLEVEVTKPGFAPIDIDHVQIYDGVDSILPVHMHPKAEGWSVPEYYDIPPPAVEDAYIRFMAEPQSYALNEVIIPDFITVHLGRPNDSSARNIRVPFPEYIKNVTASEIYSTWPRNSLLANIQYLQT